MAGRGDPRFHALLTQIGELHDKKQEDYGSDTDPFANVRGSLDWGVEPWVGALLRAGDKVHRLQEFANRGTLANESAEDSMMDIAVYALIALVLYREASDPSKDGVIVTKTYPGVPAVPHPSEDRYVFGEGMVREEDGVIGVTF